jgi:hypothetical protein
MGLIPNSGRDGVPARSKTVIRDNQVFPMVPVACSDRVGGRPKSMPLSNTSEHCSKHPQGRIAISLPAGKAASASKTPYG